MLKCAKCEAYEKEIVYLRSLVDRMMDIQYPKIEPPLDPALQLKDEEDKETIQIGEG